MDNPSKGEVSYGNPGPISYSLPNKEWHFPRSSGDDTRFYVIEQETVFFGQLESGLKDSRTQRLPDNPTSARVRKRKLDALLSTFPEFIPGANILPVFEQTSQAISDLASIHEPLASDYLAYGRVDYDTKSQIPTHLHSRKILASISEASRHIVRLSLVADIKRAVVDDLHGVDLVIEDHDQEHAAFWSGEDCTAIQQLCFSQANADSDFLAVRRNNSIDILKPIIRKGRLCKSKLTASEMRTDEHWSVSNLDPNWLLRISHDFFNGLTIVNLAFHPHIATKFATIDTRGEVMILQIEKQGKAHLRWTVEHLAKFSMLERINEALLDDIWGTVLWSDDGNFLLVSRRNALLACNLSDLKQSIIDLSLGLPDQEPCILDIRRVNVSINCYFVLTTTNLTIVSRSLSSNVSSETLQDNYRILVSIAHYRDIEDASMRLSVEACNQYIFVLIYSRIVPLVTGYKIVLDQETGEFKHITDPFRLVLPEMKQSDPGEAACSSKLSKTRRSVAYLTMRSIEVKPFDHNSLSTECLLHVLTLDDRLELVQMIVVAQNSKSILSGLKLAPPSSKTIPWPVEGHSQGKEQFVIEDDGSSEEDAKPQFPKDYFPPYRERESLALSNDFAFLAEDLNNKMGASYAESRSTGPFETALGSILSKQSDVPLGVHMLSDFLSSSLPVDGIDAVSHQTTELLDSIRELSKDIPVPSSNEDGSDDIPQKIESNILLFGQLLQELQDNDQAKRVLLVPIYERLLQLYLHALPSLAPLNARVWLEKIIRHAAMQLFMTSHSIQSYNLHEKYGAEDSTINDHGSRQFSLPIHPRNTSHTMSDMNAQPERANSRLSSSQMSSSSLGHVPTSQQTSSNDLESSRDVGATLAKYTEFRATPPIHRTMRKAVPEWRIGVAPTGFEWRSMSRSASQESLGSIRNNKQQKKDKGKGRASESESNVSAPESGYSRSYDHMKSESRQTTAFDLDDELLGSQTSIFPSSQVLPRVDQQYHPTGPMSQSFPAPSSQIVNQDSENQSKHYRLRKTTLSKKRPSGFK